MADLQDKDTGGTSAHGNGGAETPVSIERRGPGRPRKDGAPVKSQPAAGPAAKSKPEPIDAGVFADLAVSLCENGDEIAWIVICGRARAKLTPEIYGKFLAEFENVRLRVKEKDSLRAAFLALAKKYDFLSKWGPEMILFVVGVQYSARMLSLLRRVNALPDPAPKKFEAAPAPPVEGKA